MRSELLTPTFLYHITAVWSPCTFFLHSRKKLREECPSKLINTCQGHQCPALLGEWGAPQDAGHTIAKTGIVLGKPGGAGLWVQRAGWRVIGTDRLAASTPGLSRALCAAACRACPSSGNFPSQPQVQNSGSLLGILFKCPWNNRGYRWVMGLHKGFFHLLLTYIFLNFKMLTVNIYVADQEKQCGKVLVHF